MKEQTSHYTLWLQQLTSTLTVAINGKWHPLLQFLIPSQLMKNIIP